MNHFSTNIRAAVIVPAAGQGTRLGGQTKKQFRALAGKPMLERTVERIVQAPEVRWLVVATPESHLDAAYDMLAGLMPPGVTLIMAVGGATRQQSVAQALTDVPDEAEVVVVHDAARPFIDPAWISQTAAFCRSYDGAIVAIPAVDTLKEVATHSSPVEEAGSTIKNTVSREIIWQAQTPQTFRTEIFRQATKHAKEKKISGTDDAYLVESIGGRIAVVRGSAHNLKVTSRHDWEYMEWLFAREDKERHRD